MYVSSCFIHLCFALKNDEVEAFCKGLKNLVFLTHSLGRHTTRLNSLRDEPTYSRGRETCASKVKIASRKQGNISDASLKVNPQASFTL